MIRVPDMRFDEKTVLITGASSGIGRAAAIAFAEAGANLVLVARRAGTLAEVARQARKLGVRTLVTPTDVTRATEVKACFKKALEKFGTIDIVVNNAGVLIPAAVVDTRRADLQAMLNVNLFGALNVMQAAVPIMRRQGHGHIVNVGSLAGRRGFSPLGAYSATKFALVGLTEALRTELVGENVYVSLVLPSVIDTPMAEAAQAGVEKLGIDADAWPKQLTLPPSWVVAAIFAAIRLRLAEVAVPPGAAVIEKLASLAPGTTARLLRWTIDAAARSARKRAGE